MSKMPWIRLAIVAGLMLFVTAGVSAAEAEGGGGGTATSLLAMEGLLFLTSIAGFALALQALVQLRVHLMRPPGLTNELQDLVQEGNLEAAFDAAQGDNSLLGAVATATLANAQYGKDAMESAMSDTGEVEATKLMNKIGVLNLIAAIAPMLGLTGTTLGMIATFKTMSGGGDITPDKMAKGIYMALVCTFLGLLVAIPLLVIGYFLKARVVQVTLEVYNDCNSLIRVISSGEQPVEE